MRLSIGEFARHGRISVRMLRHYDAIGLLRPAHVDAASGYRSYDAAQLARLNRIVALKDLGFTLHQVGAILDDKVSVEELRGMLRLRQADLQSQIAADTDRLRQVGARLELIGREGALPREDIQIKRIPPVRVAQLNGVADGFEPELIGPLVRELFARLTGLLAQHSLALQGPAIACYEQLEESVTIMACLPVSAEPGHRDDFDVTDLPGIERAATIVHRGPMDDVISSLQALATWIDLNGYRSLGGNRELYLDYGISEDPRSWVTELQEPITR